MDGIRTGRGLTIIEAAAVVAITALLLTILLPALASARAEGRRLACLASAREACNAISDYARSFGDLVPGSLPETEDREGEPRAWVNNGPRTGVYTPYLTQGGWWNAHITIREGVETDAFNCPSMPTRPHPETLFRGPRVGFGGVSGFPSNYSMRASFFIRPGALGGDRAELSDADLRVQRLTDVRHPSGKAMLAEGIVFHGRGSVDPMAPTRVSPGDARTVVAADGRAFSRPDPESRRTLPVAFADRPGVTDELRGMNATPGGIWGVDFDSDPVER